MPANTNTTDLAPKRLWKPTPEEIDREGPYADFAAWRRWLAEVTEREAPNGAFIDPGADLDMEQEIGLYAVMCKLADGDYANGGDR